MGKIASILRSGGARGQLWRRACFASGLVVLCAVIVHVNAGRSLPSGTDDVLALAYEQRVVVQRVVKSSMHLDAAVNSGEYDAVEPALRVLEQSAVDFERIHGKLIIQGGAGVDEPIARLINPYAQIDRGLEELLLVGRSAVRRVPYLDRGTEERIVRASDVIVLFEGQYEDGLAKITTLRREISNAQRERFLASSRNGLLMLIALVCGTTPIVVFPVLGLISSKRVPEDPIDVQSASFAVDGHAAVSYPIEQQRKQRAA